ncbi:MAG: hypothetical protein AAGG81_03495 [Chlamydiota bacterium]
MSTPDKFFQINADVKPGVVSHRDDDHLEFRRPDNPPQSNKDFEKILDKRDEQPTKDTNEIAKEGPEEKDRVAKKNPLLTKEEKLETFVKETTQPDLDPRFNQAPTVDKDSKVAPKLGKEMTVAPSEEPRAVGYIEGKTKEEGKIALPGEKGKTEVDTDNLVKAMPAEKQAMKLPKGEVPEKPDHLLAQNFTGKKEIPKSPNQLFSSMAKKSEQSVTNAGKELQGEGNVNLMSGDQWPQQGLTNAADKVQAAPTQEKTYQLIRQIAEQLSVVATDSKSDTTITLKNMPQFAGVKVTVTTYPTARGEINITFENLTQEGKLILDMVDNRAALKQALDQRGLTVHMITTTTTTIERTFAESGGAQREGRGGTRDEMAEGGGGQQKQGQEEDA